MRLDFDPVGHEYRLNGAIVPSVTQLLRPLIEDALGRIPPAILERKTAIGRAVHLATELIDAGSLDESSVDPSCLGYLDAYREFLSDESPVWAMSETPLAHPTWRYAGTLDRFGELRGNDCTVDIKTVLELHPSIGVQTAAYDLLRQHAHGTDKPAARFALQLKPGGTYSLHEYKDPNDLRVFMSLLSIHHWRSRHGNQ